MSKTVFVAGATGNLGSAVVRGLVERGAVVRALVRPAKADGGDALRDLVRTGAVTAVVGDLGEDVELLAGHLAGVDVVVSAVQGESDVVVDGQLNLLRAAQAAGVPRMVPSDFSVDLHRLDYGDNQSLDLRKRADEAFAGSGVAPTSVLNGGFTEVLLAPFMEVVDLEAGTFSFWGDGEQPMDLTAVRDAGAYAAAAALDDGVTGRPVRVAGQVLTMTDLHRELERATGRTLDVRRLGSTADLEREIERRQATGTNPYEFIALQYQWAMVTGKGKLHDLDNDRYPDIEPLTVAQFLATQRGEQEE